MDIQITCPEGRKRIHMGIPNVPPVVPIYSYQPSILSRRKGAIHQLRGWKVK